jgi:U3 small nucleolar RNA-associated protein 19
MISDSHLPTQLLASFVKRLSRLSLTASPSALVALIPFIYNLLRRHPQLMVMIHNTTQTWEEGESPVHHFVPH